MHARGAGWLVFALWPTNPAFCLKFPFEARRFPYFLICGSLSLSCSRRNLPVHGPWSMQCKRGGIAMV
uniref:Putative secreted protein n=1 Tax=Anopheles darlingi TaxID=43151 RepID=A0A2M4D0P7_ANODA